MKQISLLDESIFSLITSGIGYNRTSLATIETHNENDIPVYTAGKMPVAYIKMLSNKQPIQASAEHPLLSFATNGDGSAGRNFVVHERPFYINVDRIAIDIINPEISLPYLLYQLCDIKEKYGFSHSFKANRQNLSIVMLDFPITADGKFDLSCQETVSELFNLVREMKNAVGQKAHRISAVNVSVDSGNYTIGYFPLEDILEPVKGKSNYTKKYGDAHKGKYPVFSASASNPLTYIDDFDYDGTYLSWSTNGFAGTMIVLNGKFSINGDRGLLLPKSRDAVDVNYLKYILEPIFRRLAKGRKGDHGEDEFT